MVERLHRLAASIELQSGVDSKSQTQAVCEAVVEDSGLFTHFGSAKIVRRLVGEVLSSNEGGSERYIRCNRQETPISTQDKKSHGLPRGHFDWTYWNALSDDGRADAMLASQLIFYRSLFFLSFVNDIIRIRSHGFSRVVLRAGGSARQCPLAVEADGTIFSIESALYPPRGCSASWCTCRYSAVVE